ncbi:MAG: Fe-S-containing protein [Nitrospirota bacterium]
MKKIFIFLGIILLLFSCSKKAVYPEAPADGDSVKIALVGIEEKKPVFFTFYDNGKGINYFVLKVNGDVRSYFDACARCYPKKLGYRSETERIICRACDIGYHASDLKDGIGSCYPIKLEGRVEEDNYVIYKTDLLKGKKYF